MAEEANATYRPSAEIDGSADALFGNPPPACCDTSVVRPGGAGSGAPGGTTGGVTGVGHGRRRSRRREHGDASAGSGGRRRRDQRQAQRGCGDAASPGAQGRRYPE